MAKKNNVTDQAVQKHPETSRHTEIPFNVGRSDFPTFVFKVKILRQGSPCYLAHPVAIDCGALRGELQGCEAGFCAGPGGLVKDTGLNDIDALIDVHIRAEQRLNSLQSMA